MIKKTRWELYKEKVLNFQSAWGVTKENVFVECEKINCYNCCFDTERGTCEHERYKWLYEEVEIKHELTQMEYDVLDYLNTTIGSMNNSAMLRTLKDKGYYRGVVEFENATVEEVLENHIIVGKDKTKC